MSWTDGRKLKLKILRDVPAGNDLSIAFMIDISCMEAFHRVLNGFLDACRDRKAIFSKARTVTDIETGEQTEITLEIRASLIEGGQAALVQELQNRSSQLLAVAKIEQHPRPNVIYESAPEASTA